MKKLLEAFALFISSSPQFNESEEDQIGRYLQMIMDADPEKTVLRQALQYYANEHNWPYEIYSPDGVTITGMEVDEATSVAQQALNNSAELKRDILLALNSGQSSDDVFKGRLNSG